MNQLFCRDDGNCWYDAVADQIRLLDLPGFPRHPQIDLKTDQIGFDEIVKYLCRDHRSVRAMVVSAIPELPQAEQWVENLFGGDSHLFSSFIQRHSQNQAWTDGYGIICQVFLVSGYNVALN